MRLAALLITSFLVCFITSPSLAQLPPLKSDPLSKSSSAQACSATEASCAEAAAKILPQVMGPSPMEENLRRLTDEIGGRVTGSPEMAKAIDWALASFRSAGIEVHTEKYTLATTWSEGDTRLEILGPEKFPVRLGSRRLVARNATRRHRGQPDRRRFWRRRTISRKAGNSVKGAIFSSPARLVPPGTISSTNTLCHRPSSTAR